MPYFRLRFSGRPALLVEAESEAMLRTNYARSKDRLLLITEVSSLGCFLAKETLADKIRPILSHFSDEELGAYRVFEKALARTVEHKEAREDLKELLAALKTAMK